MSEIALKINARCISGKSRRIRKNSMIYSRDSVGRAGFFRFNARTGATTHNWLAGAHGWRGLLLRTGRNRCFGTCSGHDDLIDRGVIATLVRQVSGGGRSGVAASRTPDLTDCERLQLFLAAVPEVHESAREEHRGEH